MSSVCEDIDKAFDEDNNLDELGVVMSPAPPAVIVVEHKLGISVSVLKPVFIYALGELNLLLQKMKQENVSYGHENIYRRLISLTRTILIVKGDMRRTILHV